MRIIATLLILFLTFPSYVFADTENLDELMSRRTRISTAAWGKDYFETPTTLVWQPETLTYTDITTGHEITKINASANIKNTLPDISWSHYSADGKRLAFGSHRATGANNSSYATNPNQSYQGSVMLMKTDGNYLRPADNAPFEVYVNSRYHHWSTTIPDTYYGFGRNYASEGLNTDDLYTVTVSDTTLSKVLSLDLGTGDMMDLKKAINSDSTKLFTRNATNFYEINLTPSISITDVDGWGRYKQLDDYWGNTPQDTAYTFHDEFLIGVGATSKIYFVPEGYSSWWRYTISGSDTDGGPLHISDNTAPYDWGGEVEPVLTGFASGGTCVDPYKSPWNCDSDPATGPEQYISHPGFDRWGKYMAGTNSQQYRAWGVWGLETHEWVDANISAPHYNWHSSWTAWSDYFTSSASSAIDDNSVRIVKYDGTETSIHVANAHIRESGSTDYNSLPRVTQSPDGTKLLYHSDFLNSVANNWDLFQAVAYYPYAPEITATSATGGTTTIRFDWQNTLADPNPRTYTTRGWPNELTDDRPIPRETEKYRLWRSTDKVTWSPVKTINANHFTRFDFADGGFKAGQDSFWEITDTPGDGTFYYAVTSIEHSGLESRTLSNIFAVTIASGTGTGSQDTAYPVDPGADSNITTAYNSECHKYYNIYAEDGATPTIDQTNRIASDPRTTKSFVDWLGNTDGTTQYAVTAVDTQGNESEALSTSSVYQQAPATAAGQYTITWTEEDVAAKKITSAKFNSARIY